MKIRIKEPNNDGHQKSKVTIHDYDLWNLDYTLALVIRPALIQFRDKANGVSHIEACDLPPELAYSPSEARNHNYQLTTDRWNWLMDEMIWAFGCIIEDIPNSEVNHDRVKNGLRLFGKYYLSLWW